MLDALTTSTARFLRDFKLEIARISYIGIICNMTIISRILGLTFFVVHKIVYVVRYWEHFRKWLD